VLFLKNANRNFIIKKLINMKFCSSLRGTKQSLSILPIGEIVSFPAIMVVTVILLKSVELL
jgi:hypothetical protein